MLLQSRNFIQVPWFLSVVPRSAALSPCGNLLEVHIIGPQPRFHLIRKSAGGAQQPVLADALIQSGLRACWKASWRGFSRVVFAGDGLSDTPTEPVAANVQLCVMSFCISTVLLSQQYFVAVLQTNLIEGKT